MRVLAWLIVLSPVGVAASCGLAGSNGSDGFGGQGSVGSSSVTTGGGRGDGGFGITTSSSHSSGATGGASGTGGGGAGQGGTTPGTGGSGGATQASSSSTGGGVCSPEDMGVCCMGGDKCDMTHCCQNGGVFSCQANDCPGHHFDCDDSRDCGSGKVCCATFDGTQYGEAMCRGGTACPNMTFEMCDVNHPQCAGGVACNASAFLGGAHGYCL